MKYIQHTVFLTSARDGDELSVSRSDWFISFLRSPSYSFVSGLGKSQNLLVYGVVIIIATLTGN